MASRILGVSLILALVSFVAFAGTVEVTPSIGGSFELGYRLTYDSSSETLKIEPFEEDTDFEAKITISYDYPNGTAAGLKVDFGDIPLPSTNEEETYGTLNGVSIWTDLGMAKVAFNFGSLKESVGVSRFGDDDYQYWCESSFGVDQDPETAIEVLTGPLAGLKLIAGFEYDKDADPATKYGAALEYGVGDLGKVVGGLKEKEMFVGAELKPMDLVEVRGYFHTVEASNEIGANVKVTPIEDLTVWGGYKKSLEDVMELWADTGYSFTIAMVDLGVGATYYQKSTPTTTETQTLSAYVEGTVDFAPITLYTKLSASQDMVANATDLVLDEASVKYTGAIAEFNLEAKGALTSLELTEENPKPTIEAYVKLTREVSGVTLTVEPIHITTPNVFETFEYTATLSLSAGF